MTTLSTLLDRQSAAFKVNSAHNKALAEELRQKVAAAGQGGPEASPNQSTISARRESMTGLVPREVWVEACFHWRTLTGSFDLR